MEMVIRPTHGNLQDVVEISDCGRAAHQQTTPDHGAYTQQQHFQLIYGVFGGLGHDLILASYMYEAIVS